jgi:Flp pilus assembly protein TadG
MKLFARRLRTADRGQAILLIALAMVAIAAFVGLMVDVGVWFIEYGKLKRGIDAGAIAAVQQFRNGYDPADLAAAATNFLTLNDTSASNITIFRCKEVLIGTTWVVDTTVDGTMHDATLCTTPRRKLIRLVAERWVNFAFLRVIGINGTLIRARSVGEAASIDLVLVIDTSASMAYETDPAGNDKTSNNEPLEDPAFCNDPANATPCQPLTDVKARAVDFVNNTDLLFFPYDRVAIIAMTSQEPDTLERFPVDPVLTLNDNRDAVINAINSLKVHEPVACNWGGDADGVEAFPPKGTCRNYGPNGDEPFKGISCPIKDRGVDLEIFTGDEPGDPTSCGSSNIGGALIRAGLEFARPGLRRDEALWVVILLAGGPANATDPDEALVFPDGFCPMSTWNRPTAENIPNCRGADVSEATRHYVNDADTSDDLEYDADDYARDQADFLANPVTGQDITLFTIGLGEFVQAASLGDPYAGEKLLRYVAEEAAPGVENVAHGFYRFSPDPAGLQAIFDAIAENIFTRIAQ